MTRRGGLPERNAEIDRAFAAALDLDGPERIGYLAELRARDPGLAAAVERLLDQAARPDPRLDPDRWAGRRLRGWTAPRLEPAREGERVGPYVVLREIGRGGMSVVYLAERADGLFEQRVALKFVGAWHELGIRRFQRERRILAGLAHPNIARLLDGGSDDRGRPYIVMEYVEGRPLDVFCEESGADVALRLELVGVVAQAVEYAHRNLVVHRDLKPSNILVTAEGHVKLLDFGIAKLLSPPDPADSAGPAGTEPVATQTLVRVLTPEYASPEQVRGERITTASDVYQLGVLLYHLLSGRPPHALAGATLGQIETAICSGAAPPPSIAAARAARTLPGIDDPAAVRRKLRGELDAIVLKAMDPEPERRYASVGELRDDLIRYGQGIPLRARAPTPAYRALKFVRRHRTGVAAAAVLAGLLGSYVVTVTAQSRRIAAEAAKTEQVKEILVGLFTAANPGVSQGREPTASDLLQRGAERVAELHGQPDVQAELMALLGQVYGTLGRYDEAAALLAPALETRRRVLGPSDPELARTILQLAQIRHIQGNLHEAEALMRESLAIRTRAFGEHSGEVGLVLDDLGDLLHTRGELVEAEDALRLALSIQLREGGDAGTTRRHLANVRRDRGAFREAEALYRRSLADTEARFGVVDPIASLTRSELAVLLALTEREEEAEALLRTNLTVYETLYPGGHPMMATTFRNLGIVRLRQGRLLEARQLLERAVDLYRTTLSAETSLIPRTRRHIAEALLGEGELDAAAAEAEEAVARLRALRLDGHPALADALEVLGLCRLAEGRPEAAAARLEEALAIRERLSVDSDPRLNLTRAHLEKAVAGARSGTGAGQLEAANARLLDHLGEGAQLHDLEAPLAGREPDHHLVALPRAQQAPRER